MDSKVIKYHQWSVEKSHDVVLKLILNSDQVLSLFRQKQIHTGLLVTKSYKKGEDFFIQLLYACLHSTNNNLHTFISIEEILDQSILLNRHTRMDFKHTNQGYFRQIYHYQGSLQIYTTRSYLLYNSEDWKQLLRTESFQKSLLKIFC